MAPVTRMRSRAATKTDPKELDGYCEGATLTLGDQKSFDPSLSQHSPPHAVKIEHTSLDEQLESSVSAPMVPEDLTLDEQLFGLNFSATAPLLTTQHGRLLSIVTNYLSLLPSPVDPESASQERKLLLSVEKHLHMSRRDMTSASLNARTGDLILALKKVGKGMQECISDLKRVRERSIKRGCGSVVSGHMDEAISNAVGMLSVCEEHVAEVGKIQRQLRLERHPDDPLHMFPLPQGRQTLHTLSSSTAATSFNPASTTTRTTNVSIPTTSSRATRPVQSTGAKPKGVSKSRKQAPVKRTSGRLMTFEEKKEAVFAPIPNDYPRKRASGSY